MIWNREIECAARAEIKDIQWRRLRKTVAHVYENVPFYRKRLDEAGLLPDGNWTLKDFERLPFTTKEDLRQNYPYNLFAVPMKRVVRIHASSGTTGKPTPVGYTRDDLDMWSECMARIICMAGGSDEDIAQISFGYGLFTGALGLHQGLEKIGAAVIPISSGNTEKQLMIMRDFGSTILVSTPSYALYMADMAREMGVKKESLKLKLGLFGAEGHTAEMNREIESRWGILSTENYGLSEIVGPGVSGECHRQDGMHINEDCFLPEIVNPRAGEVLPLGAEGEMVITTLRKEAFPLLRYRTKDITSLLAEPCACGRTSMRMTRVRGRSDDMLIIKGVNVYPSQVESVILGMEHISPYYQLVVTKKGFVDALEVQVELVDDSLLDRFSDLERVENMVRAKLHSVLGLDCKIRLREPGAIERTTGKAKHVIDLRDKQ
ncbi:MAG: phenylacetate--CoA ligase [Clostridiales bacterium]|jgi:phenylacetate-CoA ligase|nr:phenylacetate--CoA ligase [Clostridiales bacterium]